jgi:alpha-galactosidase
VSDHREVLVLIGAGSTVFTPGLLTDLAQTPAFQDLTVRLVDTVPEAAEVMAALGRRIAAEHGSGLRVEAVADRREALRGARFVATVIAVGSAEGWRRDLEIPERFGVRQTVGDSVGPGGVLRALRHVPEMVAIGEDIADVAPGATLFNYSNPLSANVRAVTRETGVRAVGLCHGTMHTKTAFARALQVDEGSVVATFAGLNHLSWLLDLRTADRDLYPELRRLVEQEARDAAAPSDWAEGPQAPVSADLLRTFGLYPAPGDRHVAEFFSDYLTAAPGEDLAWGLQAGLDATRQYIDEKSVLWDRLRGLADGSLPLGAPDAAEAERLVPIIEAIRSGRGHVELAVNLPNSGLVSNLPGSAIVEVPAVIGADGIRGVAVGPLPDAIAALLTARSLQQELTVDAAVRGDRELALQALALDPLVPTRAIAVAALDAAVEADPAGLAAFTDRARTAA